MTTTEDDTRDDGQLYRDHALELTRYATVLVGPDDAADIVTDAVLSSIGVTGLATGGEPPGIPVPGGAQPRELLPPIHVTSSAARDPHGDP